MSLLILYGTETGTAEDVSQQFVDDARYRRIPFRIYSMDDYNIEDILEEDFILFVIATSGEGEMPANMRQSWKKLLNAKLPHDFLSHLKYAVFGLGDSSYNKYNFAGKKFYRRLKSLGGYPIMDLGLGDDQHELGIEGSLDGWKKEFWKILKEINLFPNMVENFDEEELLPSKYSFNQTGIKVSIKEETFEKVTVVSNERVTSEDHFQETHLLRLNSHFNEKLTYVPGDVLMVYPRNTKESVKIAIEALGYTDDILDRPFTLSLTDNCFSLPPSWLLGKQTSIRECLEKYFDLQCQPKKSLCVKLAKISRNDMEKGRLKEFGMAEGLDDFIEYCVRPRRTVAELLRDFHDTSKNIDPIRLFDILPTIRARAFSIASSPSIHKHIIEILVAKVCYKVKKMVSMREGLCSTYISNLMMNDKVFVKIRKGTFIFPNCNNDQPVILIGPGTGVAPFRSLLNERNINIFSSNDDKIKDILFFGCRGPNKDYYFKNEWCKLRRCKVYVSFSRDGSYPKEYVQNRMKKEENIIWDLFYNYKAIIYIAGSATQMPKDVMECLKYISSKNGITNNNEFWDDMEKKKRVQFETWS
uniref:NADPH-dependent diflavin oxidoreductase 1 n=1 Tax=Parastrongyloides trichosuri TaxID=131310 RepID=A0A0N4ZQF6_PARTI